MSEKASDRGAFITQTAALAGVMVVGGAIGKIFASSDDKPVGEIERMHEELQSALKRDARNVKWLMGVDMRKCIGCDSCSVACAVENATPVGHSFRTVFKETTGEGNAINQFFMPGNCQQCDDPPCLKAANLHAPEAIQKRADGIVTLNHEVLKKSKKAREAALKACPYHAFAEEKGESYLSKTPKSERYESMPVYEAGQTYASKSAFKGSLRKCTFCLHRLNSGMLPTCVTTCIGRAMYFGDMNDPGSLVVEKFKGNSYFLHPANKPQVAYIGYETKEEISRISKQSCIACHE